MMKPRKTPYWWAVIEKAKERKKAGKWAFTHKQEDRASKWTDCACGRADPRIPRATESHSYDDEFIMVGAPLDAELRHFGIQFQGAVLAQLPSRAVSILRKIERRAAQILAGIA